MGNSNVIHRILVNAAVDTKLTSINCVKSSADKDDFSKIKIKSETNVVSLHRISFFTILFTHYYNQLKNMRKKYTLSKNGNV